MIEQQISQKIVRNTIFNILGRFWMILVVLFLNPYIISRIGLERFGIWALVGVLTGYFGLLDFGLGQSFVKYISEHYAKKEYKEINQIVNSGVVLYMAIAVVVIAVAFLSINPILKFLKVPSGLHSEAEFVFLLGITLFAFFNILSPFVAVQSGLQRMDIFNKIAIGVSVPMIIGTVFFLEKGYGLPGLMINNMIMLSISNTVGLIAAYRILPQLKFNPRLLNRAVVKKLFSYGFKLQIIQLEGIFTFQTDKLLISYFLNLSLVGFYQLGSVIINQARSIPLLLISAIVPAASELDARQDKRRLYDLYLRGTKYLAAAGVPLLALVFLTAPLIMLAWMGRGYERSVWVIQILAPCYVINLLTGMATSIALGIGRPEFQLKTAIFQFILNLILSIILVIKIGFAGIVVATLIALSLSSVWFMVMFHRFMRYPLLEFTRRVVLKPLLIASLPAVIIGFLNANILNLSSGRFANLFLLAAEAAFFVLTYVFFIWRSGYFDSYDKSLLRDKFLGKA